MRVGEHRLLAVLVVQQLRSVSCLCAEVMDGTILINDFMATKEPSPHPLLMALGGDPRSLGAALARIIVAQ